ncbi:MAG: tRNA (adenosine(37)-N6)-threonylcarbamoyltransferase complex dimerization subunit type 1 TsaB [Oscillospiraceae bacterium]|nr:tRNA (adenosine(37)-N6)-threonylcarbamoyltransferase complex dimerization subunit type 1 TsaB [Oscillospiraceae bacterium]MBR0392965.1 tRNA (adenosine(37)-N6)-threonylcarbamoyltransferase complex dimerization subunit type 1 TsaB [Oscillospiraceae bacterium]
MLTLAFESSAKAASVALCEDGRMISMVTQCSGLTHSRTLLPMAEDLLKNADVAISSVDRFAVAHGPGSFTGIRIGVSTVKGLSWAAEKPCLGVSTLAAMAWNGIAADRMICAVMDARRNEVYNALFRVENNRPIRVCKDRAVSLELLAGELRELGEKVFLVGDGAQLTAEYLRERKLPYRLAPENLRWQNAWGVAMEAAGREFGTSQDLLPVYLRLSQAERERQARMSATVSA